MILGEQEVVYAVWSSLTDDASCRFCTWADGRFVVASELPVTPPAHPGCRCIISFYTQPIIEEDKLLEEEMFDEWGDVPEDVLPIGKRD